MKILNVKFKISRSFETSVDLVSSQLCWIIIIVCRLVDCTNIIIGIHFSEKELRLNVDKKNFQGCDWFRFINQLAFTIYILVNKVKSNSWPIVTCCWWWMMTMRIKSYPANFPLVLKWMRMNLPWDAEQINMSNATTNSRDIQNKSIWEMKQINVDQADQDKWILQILRSCRFGQSLHSQRPRELGLSVRSGPPGTPV